MYLLYERVLACCLEDREAETFDLLYYRRMLEIPWGLRYDLIQRTHARLFVGGGLSSYYVQNEKYQYHYEKYVHGQRPGWEGKTGWFWLSHLSASVGYERAGELSSHRQR